MGSLYDLLKQRRMVRHYSGEPVARDTLERIAATVRRAPSGGFSQGQRLLIVDDPDLLARIAALLNDDPLEGVEPWMETAAAQVFVMTREDDYHERYQKTDKLEDGDEIEWPVPFWHVDAGAAMMLVLLAAIEEDLAAAVYGIFGDDERKLRELLRVPEDFTLVAGITIGYPLPDPGWSSKTSRATQRRRTLDELVHWNSWTS
ncbi:MAG TPA: nitroreductase family protein [Gaiellaceae bacterium]|jgi:nitroreductase